MSNGVPVAEGVFTWPSERPQLIGATCGQCGTTTFPKQASCPRCTSGTMNEVLLPTEGKLWAHTVQAFRPKSPPYIGTESAEEFVPFGVGYVELADALRVEARLTESNPDKLRIGMDMHLTITPFTTNDSGDDVLTFAFAPTNE